MGAYSGFAESEASRLRSTFANLEVRLFLLFLGHALLHLRGSRLGTHSSVQGTILVLGKYGAS